MRQRGGRVAWYESGRVRDRVLVYCWRIVRVR